MAESEASVNPLNPAEPLKQSSHLANGDRPQSTDQPPLPEDSAMAKAEKVEWKIEGTDLSNGKRKREDDESEDPRSRKKGVAPIRAEYILDKKPAVEGSGHQEATVQDSRSNGDKRGEKGRKKQKGQNTNRSFGSSRDALQLCMSRATQPEFSPKDCQFGDGCKYEHDLRRYLKEGKRDDLQTFEKCPVWQARGKCSAGWRCRFAMSHAEERETSDGKKELVLTEDSSRQGHPAGGDDTEADEGIGVVNIATPQNRIDLSKRRVVTPKADEYMKFLNDLVQHESKVNNSHGRSNPNRHKLSDRKAEDKANGSKDTFEASDKKLDSEEGGFKLEPQANGAKEDSEKNDVKPESSDGGVKLQPEQTDTKITPELNGSTTESNTGFQQSKRDMGAAFVEPAFAACEKRRLYFGPETPVLAPLTTQGNLPFRRLCVGLGAQVTWSEMAMSLPIIQGQKSEWALMKAHQSELESPRFEPKSPSQVVKDYDNARDLRFGTQISANKPWQALKATEILTNMCPQLRAIDLNCGCPIDLVYRQGAGSALMDSPSKLEKILRGMNAVSGEVPIQVKIRMGTSNNKPTADRLVERLAFGGLEAQEMGLGAPGVAAVTLHGRSRQQRYTKLADWSYIAECASLIKGYNKKRAAITDTVKEPDARTTNASQRMYFIGNGDCYSHVDYFEHIEHAKVDSVMVARGALIKPWIFEEISTGQYLDKSSSERLRYIEQFVRYGLETWGSDEMGVGTTRRFLLEWLSFACRYVPIGLLEHLPPAMNDRPPAYRGRDDLETLMASDNVKDWIKISEMFLGPAHENFRFDPKHKSNSYDTENDYTAEG